MVLFVRAEAKKYVDPIYLQIVSTCDNIAALFVHGLISPINLYISPLWMHTPYSRCKHKQVHLPHFVLALTLLEYH